MDNIPESFSPYSIDTLYEALTMVANSNLFDETITKSIIETRDCLMLYTKDEESLKMLNKKLSMLRMEEAIFERITKYKKRMGSRS